MCGINGLFSIGGTLPENTPEIISGMNKALHHRGPDDEGLHFDPSRGIALGHRRLSIIDLSVNGHQPMSDDSGNVIVFNGEIYNYKELRGKFLRHRFRTESDTEVLLHVLNTEDAGALESLNGMFAFAHFNITKNELLLARDRAGKKPIYYTHQNGIFAFSSEIKSLLTLPWITATPDDEAIYDFLTYNQLDAPATMFKGIFKLEPAGMIRVGTTGILEKRSWWNHTYTDLSYSSEKELSDRVFETLDRAVGYRMVSDVPVGAFLSGGVDSSAVVALMRNHSSGTIKTYSVGFEGQESYDERKYAERVARLFQTEHIEKCVSKDEIAAFLPDVVNAFDEPMADATCIPIWFISKLARDHGTIVVQTGDGADELFAGYSGWKKYHRYYPYFNFLKSLPGPLPKAIGLLSGLFDESSPAGEMIHRIGRRQQFFWGGAKAFKEKSKHDFLNKDWLNKINQPDSYRVIAKHHQAFDEMEKSSPWLNDIDRMCYMGFKFQIPNKYLYRMDRLGMAHSIEIRSPFLDPEMIRLALSMPSSLKVKKGEPKYILKKSLESMLPNDILYRKKMGFCVPLKEWAEDIMLDYVRENGSSFCSNTGIFSERGLNKQIEEISSGNKNYTNNLWTIYFLMSWFKRWI
jgi:asparagine synthase (glutamine-hydrolysing)